jgi:uncharacterized protein (DUF433 family)
MNRITFNPDQCGGRPCIRGMRIRVTNVLDLLASGLSFEEILEEMPDLEAEDTVACLQFATREKKTSDET